jgi:hypothetical protein
MTHIKSQYASISLFISAKFNITCKQNSVFIISYLWWPVAANSNTRETLSFNTKCGGQITNPLKPYKISRGTFEPQQLLKTARKMLTPVAGSVHDLTHFLSIKKYRETERNRRQFLHLLHNNRPRPFDP